ncbi:hypothetical protein D3C77_339700 [compost metagenome]
MIKGHGVAIHFPAQALNHLADLVVAGLGNRQGALQHRALGLGPHVHFQVVQQVGRCGFHAIGFGVQRPRADAHGLIVLVVALGIVAQLLGGHLDEGVLQAQLWQQLLLHEVRERRLQAAGREVAEQAQAGVGVQPVGAGCVVGFPMGVITGQVGRRLDRVGKLQGQAARTVGPQVEQGDAIERGALERRPVLAGGIAERQRTAGLGVSGQGGGEGLAHRADLEQGLRGDRLCRLLRCNAKIEVMLFAVYRDRHGHAGNPLLLHQRADDGVDGRFEWGIGERRSQGGGCAEHQGGSCQDRRDGPGFNVFHRARPHVERFRWFGRERTPPAANRTVCRRLQ